MIISVLREPAPLIMAEGVRGPGAPEQMLDPVSSLPGASPRPTAAAGRPTLRGGDGHVEVTRRRTLGTEEENPGQCPEASPGCPVGLLQSPEVATQRIGIELGNGVGERQK